MTQEYKQTSFLEAFPAKRSVKQDYKKAEVMTDGSGMKCLMLLKESNQDGLLEKMCKELLTSKTAWYSDRCKTTWKVKVSKSNVSLFQLQASVLGIKEKESGSWLQTPTTQDARIGPNNIGGNQHRIKRGSIALADQILFPTPTTMDHIDRKGMRPSRAATNRKTGYLSEMIKMYPTPRAADVEGGAVKDVKIKNGHFYRENKKGERWGVKLRDAVQTYPTPRSRDYKDSVMSVPPSVQKGRQPTLGEKIAMEKKQMEPEKLGGKLNPEFVEFLMGYPMGWTKIEPSE
jgi:hypothetical protein